MDESATYCLTGGGLVDEELVSSRVRRSSNPTVSTHILIKLNEVGLLSN